MAAEGGIQVAQGSVPVDVVGFGRAATAALAARLAEAKAGHPLDPVTVVVPSNRAGLSVRRLLGSGQSADLGAVNVANVSFDTAFRLAERIGAPGMGDRRPLTNPVLAASVRAVLGDEAGFLAGVAQHTATQSALAAAYSELSRARPETLAAIAGASQRGAEVVRLVGLVRDRLAGYYDEDDLVASALKQLGSSSPDALIWFLPERTSPVLATFMGQAVRDAPMAAVIVALTGAEDADAPVRSTLATAGLVAGAPAQPVEGPYVDLVSLSDPDEEVRHVVRQVMALAEAGTPLDRMAVFRPKATPYARTLIEQLDGAGIAHHGPAARRLADSAAGRTLMSALGLHPHWGRGAVMALIASSPVRHDGHLTYPTNWDRISRQAGVVAGIEDWREKLTAFAQGERSRAEDDTEERGDWWVKARYRDAESAEGLVSFVDGLVDHLAALTAPASWSERCTRAAELLTELLGHDNQRHQWPNSEIEAAAEVEKVLVRLAGLDEIEPAASFETFRAALAEELEIVSGRTGAFGAGLLVAPLAAAPGLDLDAVFVVGLVEGTCPWFHRDGALLPDRDRRRAVEGELETADDRLANQHRALLAALGAGRQHRVVTCARGELRSRRSLTPSRWLVDIARTQTATEVKASRLPHEPDGAVSLVESFEAGVKRAASAADLVDRDLRAADAAKRAGLKLGDVGGIHPGAVAAIEGRGGVDFTEWDGNLSELPVASPATGNPLSPTSLETWAKCPMSYMFKQVLHLGERVEPEDIQSISAMDQGSLVHNVLEQFMIEVLERPDGPPSPSEPWTEQDHRRLDEIASGVFADYRSRGLTGRDLIWQRTQVDILAALHGLLLRDDEYRSASGATPAHVEMAFGMHGEPPLTVTLASGRQLTFRGKADRVDSVAGGALVVLDYKTGKGSKFDEKALDKDPLLGGTLLQLAVYAEAALARLGGTQARAAYWLVNRAAKFRQVGYVWTPERRTRFEAVAEAIIDGIEGGIFPALSGDYNSFFGSHENCRYCDFDPICPRDRDDQQLAKQGAPELALLNRLAVTAVDD